MSENNWRPDWKPRRMPFIGRKHIWSIGIYISESPLRFVSDQHLNNPVLTAKDVSDVPAEFVADPFMLQRNGVWYMFFEVLNKQTNRGEIGLAVSSDGLSWTYQQIVLAEAFHLSYPHVFEYEDNYFMIPESFGTRSVRLYRAVDFPTRWVLDTTLLADRDYADASVVYFDNRWWMFVGRSFSMAGTLWLYSADELRGPWVEHPASPIVDRNAHIARPGGRMITYDGSLIRYTQDCYPNYGLRLRAFEVTELSPSKYDEKAVTGDPVLEGSYTGWGIRWNSGGMHHIDPHPIGESKWLVCVDGFKWKIVLK